MSDFFEPVFAAFDQLLHAHFAGLSEQDRDLIPSDRVLPIATALLDARLAVDRGDPDAAWNEAGRAGVHLALLTRPSDPPEVRLLDFARRQRRRYAFGSHAFEPWTRHSSVHHFSRVLTHGVRLAYLVDPATQTTSRRSLPNETADAANYLLFFLHLTAGPPIPAVAA